MISRRLFLKSSGVAVGAAAISSSWTSSAATATSLPPQSRVGLIESADQTRVTVRAYRSGTSGPDELVASTPYQLPDGFLFRRGDEVVVAAPDAGSSSTRTLPVVQRLVGELSGTRPQLKVGKEAVITQEATVMQWGMESPSDQEYEALCMKNYDNGDWSCLALRPVGVV